MVINTQWRLWATAYGTGKPCSPKATMKAYSFIAARRDRYNQLQASELESASMQAIA